MRRSEANGLIAPSVSRAAAIEAARKRTNTLRSALMSATIDAEDPFLNGVRTGRR